MKGIKVIRNDSVCGEIFKDTEYGYLIKIDKKIVATKYDEFYNSYHIHGNVNDESERDKIISRELEVLRKKGFMDSRKLENRLDTILAESDLVKRAEKYIEFRDDPSNILLRGIRNDYLEVLDEPDDGQELHGHGFVYYTRRNAEIFQSKDTILAERMHERIQEMKLDNPERYQLAKLLIDLGHANDEISTFVNNYYYYVPTVKVIVILSNRVKGALVGYNLVDNEVIELCASGGNMTHDYSTYREMSLIKLPIGSVLKMKITKTSKDSEEHNYSYSIGDAVGVGNIGDTRIPELMKKIRICNENPETEFKEILKHHGGRRYYLVHFNGSKIKEFVGKYGVKHQIKMDDKFVDIEYDVSKYKDFIYKGHTLVEARTGSDGKVRYKIIELYNTPMKCEEISSTNSREIQPKRKLRMVQPSISNIEFDLMLCDAGFENQEDFDDFLEKEEYDSIDSDEYMYENDNSTPDEYYWDCSYDDDFEPINQMGWQQERTFVQDIDLDLNGFEQTGKRRIDGQLRNIEKRKELIQNIKIKVYAISDLNDEHFATDLTTKEISYADAQHTLCSKYYTNLYNGIMEGFKKRDELEVESL